MPQGFGGSLLETPKEMEGEVNESNRHGAIGESPMRTPRKDQRRGSKESLHSIGLQHSYSACMVHRICGNNPTQ